MIMKLELIDMRQGIIVFRDTEQFCSKFRKVFTVKGRNYFIYKKLRIYIDEFIPQRDGSLWFIL